MLRIVVLLGLGWCAFLAGRFAYDCWDAGKDMWFFLASLGALGLVLLMLGVIRGVFDDPTRDPFSFREMVTSLFDALV